MTNQERALAAIQKLKELYPDAECSLDYIPEKPYELLISVRLAAQCTDARVNLVTPVLFKKFPTLDSLADAKVEDVEEIVKPCGLYKTKARDIVATCKMLRDDYNGILPDTIEELTKLPGIGRKTANLIVGDIYGKPAVVCDTHCIRITNRLGLSETKDPVKVEKQLRKILPPEESNMFCHRLVHFGRAVCKARKPDCQNCILSEICPSCQATD